MKFKKFIYYTLSIIGVATLVTACAPKENQSKPASPKTAKTVKINVATLPAPDSAPIYVAQEKGYFKDEGLDVKTTLFKDANKRDAAASAGQVDAAVVDLTSFTSYMKNNNKDWKLITQLTGRFGVVLAKNSKIKDVKELKDKKIANIPHNPTDYYMDMLLKENGMKPNDVKTVIVPQIPQRLEMLKSNQVDAAVLPQTFLTMARAQGLKVLTESKPSFQVTALAARGVLIKDPTVRQKFLKAYNRAVVDLNEHPEVLTNVLIKDLSMPKPAAEAAPKQFPCYNKAKTVSAKTMTEVLEFAKQQGFFTKKVNPKDYIVPVN